MILSKVNASAPISARKKAVPRASTSEPPAPSKEEKSLPKIVDVEISTGEPLNITKTVTMHQWETPNNSTEAFGCCSSFKECREAKDCVKKHMHVNYATCCSLYKLIKRG